MIYIIDMPVCDDHFTVIRVRRQGSLDCVEFRGDAYQRWTVGDHPMAPAQILHDGLHGMHSSVLHAGGTVAIIEDLPSHTDFAHVHKMFLEAER